jgi:hypothetical protein
VGLLKKETKIGVDLIITLLIVQSYSKIMSCSELKMQGTGVSGNCVINMIVCGVLPQKKYNNKVTVPVTKLCLA